jgi:hypothetical protein
MCHHKPQKRHPIFESSKLYSFCYSKYRTLGIFCLTKGIDLIIHLLQIQLHFSMAKYSSNYVQAIYLYH